VAEPEDEARFVQGALELLRDSEVRRRLGKNARSYAEENFGIEAIADKFERVIEKARQGGEEGNKRSLGGSF
jgi:glycosyltransferase involved in cell wall biosynthesis